MMRAGKIVSARVVPWEGSLNGVAHELNKRFRGMFPVGSENVAAEAARG
jgi:hypothetical protein